MSRDKARKNLSLGGRKGGSKPSSLGPKPEIEAVDVRMAIAVDAGVSEGKLNNYMQIKEHGNPELIEQVQAGKLKIGTARRLLTKEIFRKLGAIDKMLNDIKDAKPDGGYETADPEIHGRLVNLAAMMSALLDKLGDGV